MLQVHTLPAFTDNYFWLIQPNVASKDVFIVDPGDARVVIRALNEQQLNLKAILITHHHHDHIDGATELSLKYQIPIYGPKSVKIPMVTHPLFEGNSLPLNAKTSAKIFEIPGHTLDHIAYYFAGEIPQLFSGDTIFSAGCGRIFDGNAEVFFKSIERIKQLPHNTLIYGVHEYTLTNLRFAHHIEPSNIKIKQHQQVCEALRSADLPTLPTVLSRELEINPFLRTQIKTVRDRVCELSNIDCKNEAEVFCIIRQLKDQFR